MSGRPHVLVVGASGLFGSRLARLLAGRHAFRVSLGGRSESRVAALREELAEADPLGGFIFVPIDRDAVAVEQLRGIDVVVDCAGPFQGSGTALIEAAIAAGVHYVDLADARGWVEDIWRFDAEAKAAGVAVIAGASTTPALTHAVVAAVTEGWSGIDTIDVAIVPGNKTPKGRSVIAAILSWVGQPVRVFREARWQTARGWTGQRWVTLDKVGRRRASLTEVPDLDVLPAAFHPRVRSEFDAGMELDTLHWLIWLSGLAVRMRIVRSATAFAGIGYWVAMQLDRYGTDRGGMQVDVTGADAAGEGRMVRWSLTALDGDGPYVPVLAAAATVEAIMLGGGVAPGARPAAGIVPLAEMLRWAEGRAIATKQMAGREVPLYRRVMGEAFDRLPAVTKALHHGRPAVVAKGEAVVIAAANELGGIVARIFGFPAKQGSVAVKVVIESRDGAEHWTRFFDGRPMRSVMRKGEEGIIEETFGAFTTAMRLEARDDGLDMVPVGGRYGPVPIPKFMLPKIRATERVDAEGRHVFDVEIGLPVIGRLVAYRGWLAV